MQTLNYFDEINNPITVCDTNGLIVYMNKASQKMLEKYDSKNLIGKSLFDCHNSQSNEIIKGLIANEESNSYFTLKNGIKKFIHQTPWYVDGKISGLIEIITVLEENVPLFERK
jgi:transcriptional regulator with PAS, ATPase and Fis domain